jgi:leucyl aminopeptidase (aminopeptidase T)
MHAHRLEKLARLLAGYSVQLKAGDRLLMGAATAARAVTVPERSQSRGELFSKLASSSARFTVAVPSFPTTTPLA